MRAKLTAIAISCIVALSLVAVGARAQIIRYTPRGFCSMTLTGSATAPTPANCPVASFTGTGSGTTLTVTSVTGTIFPGAFLAGTGVPSGTYIASQVSGTTGGAGVYTTSNPTTSNSASLTTGYTQETNYAIICSTTQAVNYRDDGQAPTATPGTGGQPIAAGSCIPYNGNFNLLQFIQQTSGAIVGISYYKGS